jgi:predicted DsbA family dithiol-disulfide isomerase
VRVERLAEDFELEFDPCAYDLKPGIPPEGLSREQVYAGRVYPEGYLDNMRRMAADSGLDMKRPPLIPNTRKAHEATEFAREHGNLLAFLCGMDSDGLREALADGRYTGAVDEQIAWSRAAGITGVPTVVFEDRFAIVGAQDYEVFADVARRVLSRPAAEG